MVAPIVSVNCRVNPRTHAPGPSAVHCGPRRSSDLDLQLVQPAGHLLEICLQSSTALPPSPSTKPRYETRCSRWKHCESLLKIQVGHGNMWTEQQIQRIVRAS